MSISFQLPAISNEEVFEEFILELFNLEFPDSHYQFYGKKGNKQQGIDIISVKKRIAVQCKKKEIHRDYTKVIKELKQDFEQCIQQLMNFQEEIDQLIFVSTFNDSSELMNYALDLKKKCNVPYDIIYFGWQTLEKKVQKHISLLKKYYPSIFEQRSIRMRIPFYDINLLEGRDDLLEQIDYYANKYRLFVLCGVGGIGKSVTICSYLSGHNNAIHSSLLWVEYQLDSLRANIITQLFPLFFDSSASESSNEDWEPLLTELSNWINKGLIIIDGIEETDNDLISVIEDLSSTGWKIIITSRVRIGDYPFLNVEGLTLESAKLLFKIHCDKEDHIGSLDKILRNLDYHPLLVELIAKSVQANHSLALSAALDLINENAIADKELQQPIYVGKHANKVANGMEHQIFKYLQMCFSLNSLSAQEVKQLQFVSILPHSTPISYDFYLSLTAQKSSAILVQTLNSLSNKGIIGYRNGSFYIHTIIQLVVREKIETDIKGVRNAVIACTKRLGKLPGLPGSELLTHMTMARNILTLFDIKEETVYLVLVYAEPLARMAEYQHAIRYLEKCIDFLGEHGMAGSSLFNTFLNDAAGIYGYTGDYDKALSYFAAALSHPEEVQDRGGAISYAKAMDNFASILEKLGKYDEAQACTLNSILIFEQNNAEEHLVTAYTNMANSYALSENFEEAIDYWKKGNKLLKKYFDPEDIKFADSYNTLAMIYLRSCNPAQAKQYFSKALVIYEKYQNPYLIAMGTFNMGIAELSMGQVVDAKVNFEKALDLQQYIRGASPHNKATILFNLGRCYAVLDDNISAKARVEEAVKIYKENSLKDLSEYKDAVNLLRGLKRKLGPR